MYAVEFEADIQNGVLQIPDQFPRFQKGHAKVLLMVEEPSVPEKEDRIDFSQCSVNAFNGIDPLEYQKTLRDEW